MIAYIPPMKNDFYSSTSLTTQSKKMKKALGIAIGVIAAIAIPFFAPKIAGAIFGASSILGNAVVGAGLGALAGAGGAAVSGGDIMKGALFGALGGGIAGGLTGLAAGAPLLAGGTATAATAAGAPLNILSNPLNAAAGLSTATTAATGAVTGAATGAQAVTLANGTQTTFSKITDSLIGAAPQMIGQAVAAMNANDQAAYLEQLEAEMKAYEGQDAQAAAQRAQLYKHFMAAAENRDPGFEQRMAEAKVARQQSQAYQQRLDDLNLTGRTEEEQVDAARRFSVDGKLAQHAAGVQGRVAGVNTQNAMYQMAGNYGVVPNQAGMVNAKYMYDLARQNDAATATGAANTAQMLLQPWQTDYKLGAPAATPTPTNTNTGMYGSTMFG